MAISRPKIGVLGPGGVGGFIAGALWRAKYSVTCIARAETAALIKARGLDVRSRSLGDFVATPNAVERLSEHVDILFVTTKSYGLEEALKRVSGLFVAEAIVVPLLNGVEHVELLRASFPGTVIAASIQIEAKSEAPGKIIHTSPFARIEWALDGQGAASVEAVLSPIMEAAGLELSRKVSEAAVLWGKLVRLNALACATAAARLPIGSIRTDPEWRALIAGAVREGCQIAAAEGVALSAESVMEHIDRLPESLGTSLQRDLMAGRPSELDAIAGAVLRRAVRHGIKCPCVQALVNRIEKGST